MQSEKTVEIPKEEEKIIIYVKMQGKTMRFQGTDLILDVENLTIVDGKKIILMASHFDAQLIGIALPCCNCKAVSDLDSVNKILESLFGDKR